MNPDAWRGRRVFLTGHTGFKGGWLALWLHKLGARVSGYALAPDTQPSLFEAAAIGSVVQHTVGDIRDAAALRTALLAAEPEVVLHLAAQPLVRRSYQEPLETFSTNVMGTAHLLEAVRACRDTRAVLVVTSDKCYENREQPAGYVESDPMGGADPYSASKGCAELAAAAWRRSYFSPAAVDGHGALVATARAGNVIGGGDWAADRIVPDIVRAATTRSELRLRNPHATRPWQHVLEPLSGYLALAERLLSGDRSFADGWNFGPHAEDALEVGKLAERFVAGFAPGTRITRDEGPHPHEARLLRLDWSKARERLGWSPRWRVGRALDATAAWYRAHREGRNAAALTLEQIDEYVASR